MEGNQQKMREALEFVARMDDSSYTTYDVLVAVQKARAALSAPPRNCDVGTALEQSERFMDFCRPGNRPPNCKECKVYPKRMNKFWCQLEWAQTPYAEEGAGNELYSKR